MTENLFNAGAPAASGPIGDPARQAVHAIRGYLYQALATTLAWLDLRGDDRILLEVAEDYATVAEEALTAFQVKDQERSGSVTLNSESIKKAVVEFVKLVEANPSFRISLRFLTTADIGVEHALTDRPAGVAGLRYWGEVADRVQERAIAPLREMLEGDKFPQLVRDFCAARSDEQLRRDLIQQVHWLCGRPNLPALRAELEARLGPVGFAHGLAVTELPRLADSLIHQVLVRCSSPRQEDRVLTQVQLEKAVVGATQVALPRRMFLSLLEGQLSGTLSPQVTGGQEVSSAEIRTDAQWFIDGSTLPGPTNVLVRDEVTTAARERLRSSGSVVIVGPNGVGKSTVARTLARERGDYAILEFQGACATEAAGRATMVWRHSSDLRKSTLILENLNCLGDPRVSLPLAKLIKVATQQGCDVVITCYLRPSVHSLTQLGVESDCAVECPHFTQEETKELVRLNGGDPATWGPLAFLAGAGGHPQLTHAYICGMSRQGWPMGEIGEAIRSGPNSSDTERARQEARRNVVQMFPDDARRLLYRLSLTIRYFDRSLMHAISNIDPVIDRAGECFEQLLGPWIEILGDDLYRVSPVASRFGSEMLAPGERQKVHMAIARRMLKGRSISAGDLDAILVHSMSARDSWSLMRVATAILIADQATLERLGDLFFASALSTSVPVYREDLVVCGMLRLAQFKVLAAAGRRERVSEVTDAMFAEIRGISHSTARREVEGFAALTVLCTWGIGNHLDNWIELVARWATDGPIGEFVQQCVAELDSSREVGTGSFLFTVGSTDLTSVARLEHVLEQLDQLEPSARVALLASAVAFQSDHYSLVHQPWCSEASRLDFDPGDTARRYEGLARLTRTWETRTVSLQCVVAQAVILDEYLEDSHGALAVLKQAMGAFGEEVILRRAVAKVLFRQEEYQTVVRIYRDIASAMGGSTPGERAFALREAAISAGNCGEWTQCEEWFVQAQVSAREITQMPTMAIGLGLDSAVAAFKGGNVDRALRRVCDCLEELVPIDPEENLMAAYCHGVVRHAILWLHVQVAKVELVDGKEPIRMPIGAGSNSNPPVGVRQLPLTSMDSARYAMAEVEVAARMDVGIAAGLEERLEGGPLVAREASLCFQRIATDIDSLDARGFASNLTAYLESVVYLARRSHEGGAVTGLSAERGRVPAVTFETAPADVAELAARDAITAYCMRATIADKGEAIGDLEKAMVERGDSLGQAVLQFWNGEDASLEQLDREVVRLIKSQLNRMHVRPEGFFEAGFRFFERINKSQFRRLLTERLAMWQKSGWERIIAEETFTLKSPSVTVAGIRSVLGSSARAQVFVARLILAAEPAVEINFSVAYRRGLEEMANGG